jgi:hypothetical protein
LIAGWVCSRFDERFAGIGAGFCGVRRDGVGGWGSASLPEAAGIRDGSKIGAWRRIKRRSHKSLGC